MRPIKTSITHPLEVPAVDAGRGRIGMVMCPGKKLPQAITGPWDRDLDIDMDVLKAFGATVLVTLMENHELAKALPAGALGEASAKRGIAWVHLPIVDLSVPDPAFEAAWKKEGPRLREALANGRNVVVHCRGGRGRSGLVAARLLVELGMDPKAAFAAVRAANPLAIEMPVQEDYVLGLKS